MGRAVYSEDSGKDRDGFFANPITLSTSPLLVDIVQGESAIAQGESVLELRFTRALHNFEKHRGVVREFLGELAAECRSQQLSGEVVPKHVVGYTFTRLARLAERSFGFTQAALPFSTVPEMLAQDPLNHYNEELSTVLNAVQQNSNGRGEPTVVYMSTADFIDRYAQPET